LAADGHTLFVREAVQNAWTMRVVSVDLNTGKRQLFKEIEPPDRAGVLALGPIQMTPDGKTYVYGFTRRLSDLHVVEGLRWFRFRIWWKLPVQELLARFARVT